MRIRRHVVVPILVDARALLDPHGTTATASPPATPAGQVTTIAMPATAARLLRVVQTATAPQWWSVADLRVYR